MKIPLQSLSGSYASRRCHLYFCSQPHSPAHRLVCTFLIFFCRRNGREEKEIENFYNLTIFTTQEKEKNKVELVIQSKTSPLLSSSTQNVFDYHSRAEGKCKEIEENFIYEFEQKFIGKVSVLDALFIGEETFNSTHHRKRKSNNQTQYGAKKDELSSSQTLRYLRTNFLMNRLLKMLCIHNGTNFTS